MVTQIGEVDVWIAPKAAAKLLGISHQTLLRYYAHWGIRVRRPPGYSHRRFNLGDIMRFNADCEAQERAAVEEARQNPPPPRKWGKLAGRAPNNPKLGRPKKNGATPSK